MSWILNTRTGGRFNSLCNKDCINSKQSEVGSVRTCSNCGIVYKAAEPHPLAMGIKEPVLKG